LRFRIDVTSADGSTMLDWNEVYTPARGLLYQIIGEQDPQMAAELHEHGWAGSRIRPLGCAPPSFVRPGRSDAGYRVGRTGSLRLGSPVPQIAGVLLAAMAGRRSIRWGSLELAVQGISPELAPDHSSGVAEFQSSTPILIAKDSRYLLPDAQQQDFTDGLTANLRHRADVLGLPNDVDVEVLSAGGKRSFRVDGRLRVGATARLRVQAAPLLLDACYDGGIGLLTTEGWGWLK
jgi:CRISPR-associated endoribonuclease Cas6